MRVTFIAPPLRAAPAASGPAASADFAASLPTGGGARACGALGIAGPMLLGLQEDRPQRRRRSLLETADACLDGLRLLQRDVLDAGGASAELETAAREAEAHAAEADEDGRRLCLALALRIRLELAKRGSPPPQG